MPGTTPFSTLLEARSARALDVREDGTVLLCTDLDGVMQLHTVPIEGGEPFCVLRLDEPVGLARFVAGTRDIVFQVDRGGDERHRLHLVRDDGTRLRDLAVADGVRHDLGRVRADGETLSFTSTARNGVDFDVHLHDLRSGETRTILEGGHNLAGPPSPDGRSVAVVRAGGLALNSDLLVADAGGGGAVLLTEHTGSALNDNPVWLDCGRTLLFASDVGREFTAVARWRVGEGSVEHLVERRWDVVPFAADAATVLLGTNEDGRTRIELADAGSLTGFHPLELPGSGVAYGQPAVPDPLLLPGGGGAVCTFTGPASPSDVWVLTPDRPARRLTSSPSRIPGHLAVEPELVRIPSFDGLEVPLFLYRPPHPAPGPPPVVVWVHGGPEGQFVPAFNPVILHLVDRGFAVVAPNVRGSVGYGKAYVHLDDGRLRLDSVRDLAAVHAALPDLGLDPGRAALVGGSYGGYMVLAGLAFQPELWAAGVSVVGISSLVTFLENTSPYRRHLREVEYGSLEKDRDFLHEASPLTHVTRMRAPLLLLHGANDPRVPVGEAEQLHRELTAMGVPCELVVYPDEGHGIARLRNRLDAYPRVAAFLERHLGR